MRISNAVGIVSLIFFCTIILTSCKLSAAAKPERRRDTKNIDSSSMNGRPEARENGNPALLFESRSSLRSVKKEKKNSSPPYPISGPWSKESSMIQAYGMPKRVIESNGEIERLNLDRISSLDGKVKKVNFEANERKMSEPNLSRTRVARATRNSGNQNDLDDLEAQEAKVFRPLFVYRQQIADRYRIKPRKNPIYGAYQYGRNRPRNFGHGYN